MNIKTIVGLEIHLQLKTKTKMFCSCKNEYGLEPNTAVCPGCLGMPGALRVLNEEAVNKTITAGLALDCDINKVSTFERKKYMYPDLTGYQVSQYEIPLCSNGYIKIKDDLGNDKKIGLYRIQMEEDTAKSIHGGGKTAYMDFNRCGVCLVEIISKPEINSAKEARRFLEKLKSTMSYLEVSDCKMEEGSLRCDVNVNLKDLETGKTTSIIEIKNINSFKAVERAIEYEVERQKKLLEENKTEVRATRRWDDSKQETIIMREKYTANDYRFSTDGNVPNVEITDERINKIKENMPELIEEKTKRFVSEYDIDSDDAEILASNKELSEFFEDMSKLVSNKKLLSNYVVNELLRRTDENFSISEFKFNKNQFAALLNLLDKNSINNNTAKKVFRIMFEEGIDPEKYIRENNLIQITDDNLIDKLVSEVIDSNPESINDYLNGKDRAIGFLVGQVMKKSKGKANPKLVNELLVKEINKRN